MNNNYLYENYIKIARAHLTEKNELKALKFYKKAYELFSESRDIELLTDMALLYHKIGLLDYSKNMYLEAIRQDSNYANGYYGLGIIYDDEEDYDNAIKYYEKAIEINPNYDEAYFFLANILDEQGKKEEAINNYKKVIEINPKYIWAYANIACILEELNEDKEGLVYLEKAKELDENNYKVLFNLAVVLKKLNKVEEAIKYYYKSIENNKNYPYSYLNLAVIYKEKGNIEMSLKILTQGINETNEDFLYYHRGCIYCIIKEYDKAIIDVKESIRMNDFFYQYAKNDTELKEIWNSL